MASRGSIKREYERLLGLGIKKDELDNVALKVQSDSDQTIMNSLKSEFPSTSSLTDTYLANLWRILKYSEAIYEGLQLLDKDRMFL